jgi:antitoxin component YwqK of YwqJK toxin-antitoxin module
MKKALLLFAALLVAGCGEKSSSEGSESLSDADVERLLKEAVDVDSLQERNDQEGNEVYFQPNESEPFSGWVKKMYDSGQVQALAQLKDGKPNGLLTEWYPNGQKEEEKTYKDGEEHGHQTLWHYNGQKEEEKTFKDGKEDGPYTKYYENGQKEKEGTYKDGERDGLYMLWHENGQKKGETTFKDGMPDGLWAAWHENGQKMAEETWKDDEFVSGKWWNSKGEEVETREEALEKPATEPSADTAKPPPAESPVADSPSEEPSETPKSLSDADVERLLKEAVDHESLEERGDFLYQNDEPYSGWVKSVADSGQVMGLGQCKDGMPDGP